MEPIYAVFPTTTIAEIFRLQLLLVVAFVLFAKGYRSRVIGWEVRNLTTIPSQQSKLLTPPHGGVGIDGVYGPRNMLQRMYTAIWRKPRRKEKG